MSWALSSGSRSGVTKITVAGALLVIAMIGVSVPVQVTPGIGGVPTTPAAYKLGPAQPADPPTDTPAPPPSPPAQPPPRRYTGNDWWDVGDTGGGGGAGGG